MMDLHKEFSELVNTLKMERDDIALQLHLASMDVKEEFNTLDEKWELVTQKAAEAADSAVDVSEEAIVKAKIVGEELKAAFEKIKTRLS
jgi:lipid II:glycine glycyltransferase (peptidoglycan interpeptide bridge formation enzyme)